MSTHLLLRYLFYRAVSVIELHSAWRLRNSILEWSILDQLDSRRVDWVEVEVELSDFYLHMLLSWRQLFWDSRCWKVVGIAHRIILWNFKALSFDWVSAFLMRVFKLFLLLTEVDLRYHFSKLFAALNQLVGCLHLQYARSITTLFSCKARHLWERSS